MSFIILKEFTCAFSMFYVVTTEFLIGDPLMSVLHRISIGKKQSFEFNHERKPEECCPRNFPQMVFSSRCWFSRIYSIQFYFHFNYCFVISLRQLLFHVIQHPTAASFYAYTLPQACK